MRPFLLLASIALALSGCTPKVRPIAYGSDTCHYCRMTIVDQQHAAQVVTEKGKAFKFDAVECMLHYLDSPEARPMALFRVADFRNPGELVDATAASYLVSENLPSPMGAFLSAFADRGEASAAQAEFNGDLYDWEGIRAHIRQQ